MKQATGLMESQSKPSLAFLQSEKAIPKVTWKWKGPFIAKQSWKQNNKVGGFILSNLILQSYMRTVWHLWDRLWPMGWNWESRKKSICLWSLSLIKGAKAIWWGTNSSFNKWFGDSWRATCKTTGLYPYLTPYIKLTPKGSEFRNKS